MCLFCRMEENTTDNEHLYLRNLGNKIRNQRILMGISQQDLANDCDIPYSDFLQIELGEFDPGIRELLRIADELQFDPKELLS